ncbi:cell envelope integrity protein TolA [Providencia sp. 2.29]|uniref:phage tail fiber protein n=1 Tax=Providencia sp. 2.29 TaxID=2791982 RepID=UPI0018C99F10|nr:cell envelope integrity protein TolA [Providencia sp. 2.29]QPN39090.1 cell envelope integrity protein TolA [Providencia sp. 2.29]
MYNIGTVTTTANSTKLVGTGTKWKENNSRVSAEQVILIQNGSTIYINSIASIQSNTEITLSFPVPASVSNAPYQILTTMVNSVSDATNKIVSMNIANVQFSDILNRWATESGTITVTLPDGTTQQLRTAKEMDKQLDGKFDKAGGTISGDVTFSKNAIKSTKGTHVLPDKYGTLMQVGDYGIGGSMNGSYLGSVENFEKNKVGIFNASHNVEGMTELGITDFYGSCIVTKYNNSINNQVLLLGNFGKDWLQLVRKGGSDARVERCIFYSDKNTTKDSNGNLKAASPIVKLFADHIELNEESEGVEMEHLGIGHYLIKGVVGFNADGAWGIDNGFVIPQDHNGKNMVLIDYKVRPDGDIEVFVFHQQNADLPERFQNKRIKHIDKDGNPVYYENYEPCDVPESRWIDMRVEMPVNSIYNLKQAEAERLAKEEAERQAEEDAKKAELEAERVEQEAAEQVE